MCARNMRVVSCALNVRGVARACRRIHTVEVETR